MLLKFKSDLQAFVVGNTTVEPIIHHCIGDIHSSGEDLVKMTTQVVGDSSGVKCTGESQEVQFPVHVGYVVVEVTTHHNTTKPQNPKSVMSKLIVSELIDKFKFSTHV